MKTNLNSKLLWSLMVAAIAYLSACSQDVEEVRNKRSQVQSESPYFVVLSDDPESENLPLKSTDVSVDISGVIANVQVEQLYTNTGKTPIEAIYVFPASTRAAVHNLVMTIGEREIIAIVEETQKAQNMYDEAKEQGKTASLLKQHRPNVFQMSVANIMPGSTVKVRMSYTELVEPEDKIYQFVYPTVVGPRYAGKNPEMETADSWVNNPYLQEGQSPTSTLSINVNLNTSIPIKAVNCETHKNNVRYNGKSNVQLVMKDKYGGNRDFVLEYRLSGEKIETGVLFYNDPKGEKYFLTMLQPPARVQSELIPKREYVFIVDVSGSMSGFPLNVSKQLMRTILDNLKPTDKFNIVFFAGGSEVYAESSVNATPANILAATNYMNNMRGSGGTELLKALSKAMILNNDEDFSRSFVILTDGFVNVEKKAFDYIRQNLGAANFFSFGIGSSVNRFLIEGMAYAGNGESFIALNQEEAKEQAKRFAKYISTPVLTNIKIDFEGLEAYDYHPNQVSDLFADKPIIISGKYRGNATGSINISGVTGAGEYKKTVSIDNNNESENEALKYLWARRKIRMLSDYYQVDNNNELKEQIVQLGLDYNLLTKFTSFVAIDSEISNNTGNLIPVTQPLPLPKGVSNLAVGANTFTNTKAARSKEYMVEDLAAHPVEFSLIEFEEEAESEAVFTVVEDMPKFNGGDLKTFQTYIQNKVVFPEKARELSISGRVFVQFVVDEQGKVVDVEIVRGVHKLLDEEVIRVVKASPVWTPGKQRGKPVRVTMVIPVVFRLS